MTRRRHRRWPRRRGHLPRDLRDLPRRGPRRRPARDRLADGEPRRRRPRPVRPARVRRRHRAPARRRRAPATGIVDTAPARPAAVGKPLSLAAQPNLFRLDSLVFSQQESHTRRRSLSFASSLGLHSIILAGVITLPLLIEDVLPEPGQAIRGFFVSPPDVAPPPPPPPPPAAAPRSATRPATSRRESADTTPGCRIAP